MIASMTRRLFGATALAALAAPAANSETLEERKAKLLARDKNVSEEALARKKRSETLLQAQSVPINQRLPAIETEAQATRRSKEEVAYRTMSLMAVSMRAMGMPEETFAKVLNHYGLKPHLSPEETAFSASKSPSERDRIKFSWRCEAAYPLMWALGYVDKLEMPTEPINPDAITDIMRIKRTSKDFINDAELRPLEQILDQADLIYRYRWALVDARVSEKEPPASLNPGVAVERHRALNWLIGYMDQQWDNVSTDT